MKPLRISKQISSTDKQTFNQQTTHKPAPDQSRILDDAELHQVIGGQGERHTPFFSGYRPQFYFR